MLHQPSGMQAYLKHYILGAYSPYIRWVATLRNVKVESYKHVRDCCKIESFHSFFFISHKPLLERNADIGYPLNDWIGDEMKLLQWRRALRPARNSKKRKLTFQEKSIPQLIDVLLPAHSSHHFDQLLLKFENLLFCTSCNKLLDWLSHPCPVGKSCIFGPRKELEVHLLVVINGLNLIINLDW